jgi:hypothetical protein
MGSPHTGKPHPAGVAPLRAGHRYHIGGGGTSVIPAGTGYRRFQRLRKETNLDTEINAESSLRTLSD